MFLKEKWRGTARGVTLLVGEDGVDWVNRWMSDPIRDLLIRVWGWRHVWGGGDVALMDEWMDSGSVGHPLSLQMTMHGVRSLEGTVEWMSK